MLSQKVEKALNAQLNAEFYSAYLYLSMAAYFKSINLDGFANWMQAQYQEESDHGFKFYHYILQRGGRVALALIDAPPTEWASPMAVFEEVYGHEQKVTALINDLVELSIDERDHATTQFLQWFVAEQVEEEESADGILQQLKLIGDSKGGLFMVDRELAQRPAMHSSSSDTA